MPAPTKQPVTIPLPIRGVWKSGALIDCPAGYTPACMNVYPLDSSTARQRMGIRPSAINIGLFSDPYFALPIMYFASSTANVALAITNEDGTYTTLDCNTFTQRITTAPGALTWPSQATCAVFQQKIYQTYSGASAVRVRDFIGGAEGDLTGTPPTKCGIILVHGGRLWLMADKDNPHVYYASAIGGPTDWDYTAVTTNGAFASTGSQGGIIGERIIAGISNNDNCLLIFGTDTLYAVRGNPRAGRVEKLSDTVGCLMQSACCNDESGNTWFISRQGLYRVAAGGGKPELMSGVIPDDLNNIRPEVGDRVAVGYDSKWPGIHIFITYFAGSTASYFYSLDTQGFFPQSMSPMPLVAAHFPKLKTSNNSGVIMFAPLAAYQFKRDPETGESAESRDSYAWIPIVLAADTQAGLLHSINASLAKDSADVAWKIYAGHTAEEAFNLSSATFTGKNWSYTTSPSRYLNYWQYPRSRGNIAYLRVADVANNRWLIERIIAHVNPSSMLRAG